MASSDSKAYIRAQFDNVQLDPEFDGVMKIKGMFGETNWLNVTDDQIQKIKMVLLEEPS